MTHSQPCTYESDCFEVTIAADGAVSLAPQFNPSFENGLVCEGAPSPGLWDPDERVAVFCEEIHTLLTASGLTSATNFTLPIFNTFTVTNPSAVHVANVYWAWFVEDLRIDCAPGVRGAVATRSAIAPNPFVDAGYGLWQHDYDVRSSITMPGACQGFTGCPFPLAAGASYTFGWAYRFEGGGGAGTWSAQVGRLSASAMVVVAP